MKNFIFGFVAAVLVLIGSKCGEKLNSIEASKSTPKPEIVEVVKVVEKIVEVPKIVYKTKIKTKVVVVKSGTSDEEVAKLIKLHLDEAGKRANKNRISALGGYGPNGTLSTSTNGNVVSIETGYSVIGGLQYQRLVTDKVSVGVQGQTNRSGSLLFGLDF